MRVNCLVCLRNLSFKNNINQNRVDIINRKRIFYILKHKSQINHIMLYGMYFKIKELVKKIFRNISQIIMVFNFFSQDTYLFN